MIHAEEPMCSSACFFRVISSFLVLEAVQWECIICKLLKEKKE